MQQSNFSKEKSKWSFIFGLSWAVGIFVVFIPFYAVGSINNGSGAMQVINPVEVGNIAAWILFFVEIFFIWVVGFPLAVPYYFFWYVFGIDLSYGNYFFLWILLSIVTAIITIYLLWKLKESR